MDVWIIKETCLDRQYNPDDIAIQTSWTVVDIGAGLGDFAVLMAFEHPGITVHAVEPFPESVALLERNIDLNSVDGVNIHPIGIGAASKAMILLETGEAVQHTTMDIPGADQVATLQVTGMSLDEFFEANAIAECNLLKVDCEGCEFPMFFAASDTTLSKIKHIVLEYHEGVTEFAHTDLVDYLQQHDFEVYSTPNPVHNYLGLIRARNRAASL